MEGRARAPNAAPRRGARRGGRGGGARSPALRPRDAAWGPKGGMLRVLLLTPPAALGDCSLVVLAAEGGHTVRYPKSGPSTDGTDFGAKRSPAGTRCQGGRRRTPGRRPYILGAGSAAGGLCCVLWLRHRPQRSETPCPSKLRSSLSGPLLESCPSGIYLHKRGILF